MNERVANAASRSHGLLVRGGDVAADRRVSRRAAASVAAPSCRRDGGADSASAATGERPASSARDAGRIRARARRRSRQAALQRHRAHRDRRPAEDVVHRPARPLARRHDGARAPSASAAGPARHRFDAHRSGRKGARGARPRVPHATATRPRAARPRVHGTVRRLALRPLPREGRRELLRVHPVRANRRAPRVPVLRRAELQGAVRRLGDGASLDDRGRERARGRARSDWRQDALPLRRARSHSPRTSSRSRSATSRSRRRRASPSRRSASSPRRARARWATSPSRRPAASSTRSPNGSASPTRTTSSTSSRCPSSAVARWRTPAS